jgi:hypothetical protein
MTTTKGPRNSAKGRPADWWDLNPRLPFVDLPAPQPPGAPRCARRPPGPLEGRVRPGPSSAPPTASPPPQAGRYSRGHGDLSFGDRRDSPTYAAREAGRRQFAGPQPCLCRLKAFPGQLRPGTWVPPAAAPSGAGLNDAAPGKHPPPAPQDLITCSRTSFLTARALIRCLARGGARLKTRPHEKPAYSLPG